jgi:hypothetical protein
VKTRRAALILTFIASACSTPQVKNKKQEAPMVVDAEAHFSMLEQTLLKAKKVFMAIKVTSSGAVSSSLMGELRLSESNQAHLKFNGEFAGNPVEMHLSSRENRMSGGSGDKSFEEGAPPALNEGILLGLARMGILHNLAMLSAGSPPQGTDGNVRDWVQARNFSYDETTKAIRFEIVVSGAPSGEVELWLDEETGRFPTRRKQTVHFPEGDMHVEEIYEQVVLTQ